MLYSSVAFEQNVQLLIVYDNDATFDRSQILTTGKMHRLTDAILLVQRESYEVFTLACVAGRLNYNTILSTAFGSDFKKLSQNS